MRAAGFVRALAIAALLCMAASTQAAPGSAEPASYRLGVFPYMAPRQTVEFYGPVAASMERALKHPVRLESAAAFSDFGGELKSRAYDIALIQTFDVLDAVEKYGYVPLAQPAVPLITQFFVRDDSGYRKLEDLRGTTIAMPPAPSAIARMALRTLYDNKLVPGRDLEVRHFNSHDSCIQQAWASATSACATFNHAIEVFEERMHARLRAIHDAPPVPAVMYVAQARMPAEHRAKLQELIIGWSRNEEGRALLKNVNPDGFVAPRLADYAVTRNYDSQPAVGEAAPAASKELLLGVFPYFTPRQVARGVAPSLPALSAAVGQKVSFITATSYGAFNANVAAGMYDVVLVQPLEYASVSSQGYVALAQMKDDIQGTFFVRGDSAYRSVADFKGKVVALPPADSTAARLARRALEMQGLAPGRDVRMDYRINHESCLQAVQAGAAAACATSTITLSMVPEALGRGLRAVGLTEAVPGVLFMAHKRLPARTRSQLQAEIVSWKGSDSGRAILKSMGLGDFVPANVAEYQKLPKPNPVR